VQCVAVQCVAVQCVAVQCVAVQCVAVQCVAVQCVAVQCVAVKVAPKDARTTHTDADAEVCAHRCSVLLQHVAVCRIAVCCSESRPRG